MPAPRGGDDHSCTVPRHPLRRRSSTPPAAEVLEISRGGDPPLHPARQRSSSTPRAAEVSPLPDGVAAAGTNSGHPPTTRAACRHRIQIDSLAFCRRVARSRRSADAERSRRLLGRPQESGGGSSGDRRSLEEAPREAAGVWRRLLGRPQ